VAGRWDREARNFNVEGQDRLGLQRFAKSAARLINAIRTLSHMIFHLHNTQVKSLVEAIYISS
jgi:type VI protein secretion system component VasF